MAKYRTVVTLHNRYVKYGNFTELTDTQLERLKDIIKSFPNHCTIELDLEDGNWGCFNTDHVAMITIEKSEHDNQEE